MPRKKKKQKGGDIVRYIPGKIPKRLAKEALDGIIEIINEAKPAKGRSNLELFNLILSHLNNNKNFLIGFAADYKDMIKFNDNYNVEELTQKDPRKDKRYYELRLANKNIIDKYDSLSTGASKTFKNILIQNLIEVIQNDREYKYSQNSPVKERIDKMIKTFLSQKDKSDDDDKSGDDKSGDDKSGHDESDDDESGDDESGDDESGHDESGVKSSDVSESDSEHCKYMGVDKNFKYSKDGAQARIGSDEICATKKRTIIVSPMIIVDGVTVT